MYGKIRTRQAVKAYLGTEVAERAIKGRERGKLDGVFKGAI
jgi:hypothetical protein